MNDAQIEKLIEELAELDLTRMDDLLLDNAYIALTQLFKEHQARNGPLPTPRALPAALRQVADQVEAWEAVMTPP